MQQTVSACMQEAEAMVEGDDDDEENLVQKKKKEQQEDQREYVACLKCTHDCFYSSHSAASSASAPVQLPPTAPSFLKVLEDPLASCLEIPQAFVDACASKCMTEAKLEGPSGWVWYAPFVRDTCKNFGKAVLGSPGWDDFAHDHRLQRGDLLVLTYFSVRRLFKVRIFDNAEGIEKSLYCLPLKPHYASLSRNTSSMEPLFQEPKNGTIMSKGMKNIGRDSESKACECCKCKIEYNTAKANVHIPETEESENELIDGLACKTKKDKWKPPASNEHEIESIHLKALIPFKRGLEKKFIYGGRCEKTFPQFSGYDEMAEYNPHAVASLTEKERVQNEANAFRSKNPFLIKSLPASSIYKDKKLMWPTSFTKVYMPKRDSWMIWVDAEGEQWECLWLPRRWNDRRVSYVSAGWAAFALAHHLIEHDVCIFELINQDAMTFHVHIFKQRPLLTGALPTQLYPSF